MVTDHIHEAYAMLRQFESVLMELDQETLESIDPQLLLQAASDLHLVKSYTTTLFNEMQSILTEHLGALASPVTVDGATVEIKSGSPRKSWDHDALIDEVSRRIVDKSVDLNTGEILASPHDMIRQAMEYVGVSYWKVTNLKNLHIDADDYCEVGEPKKNLVIRRDK